MHSTKRVRNAASLLATIAMLASSQVFAHHSYAMFEDAKTLELDATVKEWQFTNPHSWLIVTATRDGKQVQYAVEGSSPNSLLRRGWSAQTFVPGDKIKLVLNPLKDGRPGGAFVKATLADGTILTQFRQD